MVHMSKDILEQVITDKVSAMKISLQLVETTHVTNSCQLMAVVLYMKSKEIEENLFFCQSMKTTLQAKDVI